MRCLKLAFVAASILCAGTAMADTSCLVSQKGAAVCMGDSQYRCTCSGSYDKPYCAWRPTGATCRYSGQN
jgi:hypothetical protein